MPGDVLLPTAHATGPLNQCTKLQPTTVSRKIHIWWWGSQIFFAPCGRLSQKKSPEGFCSRSVLVEMEGKGQQFSVSSGVGVRVL